MRFLQSSHGDANCLQNARSSGMGAIVCKSRATHSSLHYVQHRGPSKPYLQRSFANDLSSLLSKLLVFYATFADEIDCVQN